MAQNVVIVTVHGTGAGKQEAPRLGWWQRASSFIRRILRRPSPSDVHSGVAVRETERDLGWSQPDSPFCAKLLQRLRGSDVHAEIRPFEWTGGNSGSEREEAAIALKDKLKRLARDGKSIYLIGHSHGGNVIEDALERFGWRSKWWGRSASSVLGVTSVGTPFFKRRRPPLRWIPVYVITFFALVGTIASIGITVWVYSRDDLPKDRLLSLLVLVLALCWLVRSNAQFLWPRWGSAAASSWLSIWHPQDEAIAALQSMEGLRFDFYAPGAIAKKLRLLCDASIVYLCFLFMVLSGASGPAAETSLGKFAYNAAMNIWMVLLLIVTLRLLAGGFDPLLRGWANSRVMHLLRSIAFGQDHYIRLSDVATQPWVYGGTEFKVQGEPALRMRESAEKALIEFVRVNQAHIFLVGAAGTPADLMERLTWKELVHTTYFDYDEIADEIAQHIVKLASAAASTREPLASAHFDTMPAPQSSI